MRLPLYISPHMLEGRLLDEGVPDLLIDTWRVRKRARRLRRESAQASEVAQLAIVEHGVRGAIEHEMVTRTELAGMLNSPDTFLSLHERVIGTPTMSPFWAELLGRQTQPNTLFSSKNRVEKVLTKVAELSTAKSEEEVPEPDPVVISFPTPAPTNPTPVPTKKGLKAAVGFSILVAGLSMGAAGYIQASLNKARLSMVAQQAELQALKLAIPASPKNIEEFYYQQVLGKSHYRLSSRAIGTDRLEVSLQIDPNVQPPFFAGLKFDPGEEAGLGLVYRAGHTPFVPVLSHVYALPSGQRRRVTMTLYLQTTGDTVKRLSQYDVGYELKEEIPLELTPQGARVIRDHDQRVIGGFQRPEKNGVVGDPVAIEFTLQGPSRPLRRGAEEIVYLLARPLDGYKPWQDRYYVLPFRQPVDELGPGSRPFTFYVPVRTSLGLDLIPEGEPRPTRFEILIVQLPFLLQDWTVPATVLDLSDRSPDSPVLDSRVVTLRPGDDP